MKKLEFLEALKNGLEGLPEEDIWSSTQYYSEMIEDRMEEGFTEEEAVKQIGDVKEIVADILAETPLSKLVKNKLKQKKSLGAFEIILIILGSPIWISLLIALFSVIISVYAVFWAVVISVFAAFLAVSASVLALIFAAVIFAVLGNLAAAGVSVGGALICVGVSILIYYAAFLTAKAIVFLTKKSFLLIKSCFIKRRQYNEE